MKIFKICEVEMINFILKNLYSCVKVINDNPCILPEYKSEFDDGIEKLKELNFTKDDIGLIIDNKSISSVEVTFSFIGLGLTVIIFMLEDMLKDEIEFYEVVLVCIVAFVLLVVIFCVLYLSIKKIIKNDRIKKISYIKCFLSDK